MQMKVRKDESGQVMVITALAMTFLTGVFGTRDRCRPFVPRQAQHADSGRRRGCCRSDRLQIQHHRPACVG